jgi:hypothetical protein
MKRSIGVAIAGLGLALLPIQSASAGMYLPCKWYTSSIKIYKGPYVSKAYNLDATIRTWNGINAGQPKFRRQYTKTKANVTVRRYYNYKNKYQAGYADIRCSGHVMSVTIWLNHATPISRARQAQTLKHEAGHTLGLDHRKAWSIMRPDLFDSAWNPTINDIRALRYRY